MNLPDTPLALEAMTPENRDDLFFAIEHDVTYIAASFVRSAADVIEIRKLLAERGAAHPDHRQDREQGRRAEPGGDRRQRPTAPWSRAAISGVEIPLPDVPIVQKQIIRTTVMNGKPVVTATQMLDSMQRNPVPTRAEVSDVANAILDGTSAVMLSGETAAGAYPVEAVRTMAAVALRAEAALKQYGYLQNIRPEPSNVMTEAVAQAAITMANHLKAAAIITLTESGFTSRSISKYRPDCPILAVTGSRDVVRKLAMNWGVTALLFEGERVDEQMIRFGVERGREQGFIQRGDVVVATAGISREAGSTNLIRVITRRRLSRARASEREGTAWTRLRLTSLVPAGGCARKLPAEDLAALLAYAGALPARLGRPGGGPDGRRRDRAAALRPASGLHGRLHHAGGRRPRELRRDRRRERPLGRVRDGRRAAGRAGGLRRAARADCRRARWRGSSAAGATRRPRPAAPSRAGTRSSIPSSSTGSRCWARSRAAARSPIPTRGPATGWC